MFFLFVWFISYARGDMLIAVRHDLSFQWVVLSLIFRFENGPIRLVVS